MDEKSSAESSSKSKFTGNIKSRKRFRIQCWNDDQTEKIKILKTNNNQEKSTQTDTNDDTIKNILYESFKNKLEKNLDCGICKEIYLDSCILPCGHIFCSYCIRMWFLHADTCPICRITTEFVIGTKIIDNFIKDTLILFDKDAVDNRDALIVDRKSVLQKVESSWVVQNTNTYYTTPEMWQDWLNLQNNNVELLNNTNFEDNNNDEVDYESTNHQDERTMSNLWPWESEESLAQYVPPPPPPLINRENSLTNLMFLTTNTHDLPVDIDNTNLNSTNIPSTQQENDNNNN